MYDLACLLIDPTQPEGYQLALSALAIVGSVISTVVGGYLLSVIKSQRTRLLVDLATLGHQISTEGEERRKELGIVRDTISKEGDIRREKDESLGRDIVSIERRMAYDRGQAGKPFSGDD